VRKWEYCSVELAALDSLDDLNRLGDQGWLLCVVAGHLVWFARDKKAHALKTQADQHAAERSS
jgi:hypothetical protein